MGTVRSVRRRLPTRSPALTPDPLLLLGAGVAVIVVLHVLRTDVHPARHYVSEYGNEAWWWMLSVALLLVAGGLVTLAATLRGAVLHRAGPRLLQLAAALLVVAAICSTDRRAGEVETATLAGQVHGLAAIGAFVVLVLAMATLSPRFGGEGHLGRVGELALAWAAVAVTPVVIAFLVIPEAHGLRQRLFLAIVFAWLLAAAAQVRSLRRA